MRQKFVRLVMIGLFSLASNSFVSAQERVDGVDQWDFDVYLNDKKVGKHLFKVSEKGGEKQVRSEADFKYKILFVPVYQYEHSAVELWADNCLTAVNASTNANGRRLQVSGARTGDGFVVESDDKPTGLPQCVMTFAYWNPDFLRESQLLNPQTGEYVEVRVEEIGDEVLEVRGQAVEATRFRLTTYETDVTLWYSSDSEWLALESIAKGGHLIRYELS